VIHEVVIQLRRKRVGTKDLFPGKSARKIGTWMVEAMRHKV
jgi:hypothetical protein